MNMFTLVSQSIKTKGISAYIFKKNWNFHSNCSLLKFCFIFICLFIWQTCKVLELKSFVKSTLMYFITLCKELSNLHIIKTKSRVHWVLRALRSGEIPLVWWSSPIHHQFHWVPQVCRTEYIWQNENSFWSNFVAHEKFHRFWVS